MHGRIRDEKGRMCKKKKTHSMGVNKGEVMECGKKTGYVDGH